MARRLLFKAGRPFVVLVFGKSKLVIKFILSIESNWRITYNYDANSNLIRKIESGKTWNYNYDDQNYLIQVNEILYIGGSNGKLDALNPNSGKLIWDYEITQNMSIASPAIEENILCICCSDGYLRNISAVPGTHECLRVKGKGGKADSIKL